MDYESHHICKDDARSGRHLAFWDALMGFRDPWIIYSAGIPDDFGKVAGNFFKQFFATSPLTMLQASRLIKTATFLVNFTGAIVGQIEPEEDNKRPLGATTPATVITASGDDIHLVDLRCWSCDHKSAS